MSEADEAYARNLEMLVNARTEEIMRARTDLFDAENCILEAYGDGLQLKHPATAAHSRRLVPYSIALGRAMGLGQAEIMQVARAAFLHDVGKLAIPDALLAKGAQVSQEEEQTLRQHCVRGYEMVRKKKTLLPLAEIVLAHHERWDGGGYPNGLKAESIPKGARMVAVLNVFDNALYRDGKPLEAAVQEIANGAGTQFDPEIVEAFLSVQSSMWAVIGKQAAEYRGFPT